MTERSMPIDDETLRRHGASLRTLARSLVGDDQRAEDIVQEAWLTAVERPPRKRAALFTWLSRVVRNLAFSSLSRERQRGERERAAARAETVEDVRETELGFEHQERLVRALRSLREPYRTTIHLRYYRELSPGEIAVRQGVSLETVRTRLRRGLALLREKLDAAYGDRDAWHAGLLALVRPRKAAAAPLTTATTLGGMILMKKLVIGATAAGLVALVWVAARDVSTPAAVERAADPEEPASLANPVAEVVEPAGDVAPARVVVPQREGSAGGASAPPAAGGTVVRGRLLLPNGGPATGAVIELHGWRANTERAERFGDPEGWQDPGDETADGDGAFTFRFDPHRALQFTLDASLAGHVGAGWRWSEIEPGSVVDVGDVVLELAGSIRGRIVDGEGNPIEGDWGPSAESSRKAGEGRERVWRRGSFDPESAEFVIDGLPGGRVRLKAYSRGVTV
ncbi:MAG: RNA polymerase sigma factor, partial [Planctomycetota bacterium]|nr:RNA polymerase sigma factor [Planctomycetota bacterium]